MNFKSSNQFEHLLNGPLPKRGGLSCPAKPWLKRYRELNPVGHRSAHQSHWDPDFILAALNWAGPAALQTSELELVERRHFVLPHFTMEEDKVRLNSPPGDFAGSDAFAFALGLARESEKTERALEECPSPAEALQHLVAPEQKRWAEFDRLENGIKLVDLMQHLLLGSSQRFVRWLDEPTEIPNGLYDLIDEHRGPVFLLVGHTHRVWDGASPFPRLFGEELESIAGEKGKHLLGLDLLRTHQPATQLERLAVERKVGIQDWGGPISIRCEDLQLQHVDDALLDPLRTLQQNNALLILHPAQSERLARFLSEAPKAPKHVVVVLEGPTEKKNAALANQLYDCRQRRAWDFVGTDGDGVGLLALPSLGFLPAQARGDFCNAGSALFETLQHHCHKESLLEVLFNPVASKSCASFAALNLLTKNFQSTH